MTLLGGDLQSLMGGLFRGVFVEGTFGDAEPDYDDEGDLVTTDDDRFACKLQVDKVSERMTRVEGYTEQDVMVVILSKPGGKYQEITKVDSGEIVTVAEGPYEGSTFKLVAPIDRDPGGVGWTCRGVRSDG